MEDAAIIQLFFDRAEQAISETQTKYGAYCAAIIRNILSSPEDREECQSDVYLRLWNRIPPERPGHFQAFLGTIARNLALNKYRSLRAQKRDSSVELAISDLENLAAPKSLDDVVAERELVALLNRFLSELPKQSRIMFVKRYWYMSPIREIAERMGCTEGQVKMTLQRTRKRLAERIKEEWR